MNNITDVFGKCNHKLLDSMGNVVYDSTARGAVIKGRLKCIGSDGSVLFANNQTIYPGRKFILERLFGKQADASQSYFVDDVIWRTFMGGADTSYRGNGITNATTNDRTIAYFGVGVGGCGLNFGNVYATSTNAVNANNLIPLRVVEESALANDNDEEVINFKNKYKLCVYKDGLYYFFLKKFEAPVVNATCFSNEGSTNYDPVTEGVWTQSIAGTTDPLNIYPIQTYVSINIDLSASDLKEYYMQVDGNLTQCRFNELCLFAGKEVSTTVGPNGIVLPNEVAKVEAFSHLTFNNRPMDSDGASYTFTYTMTT